MKSRSAQLSLAIICFLLGLLVVAQFRTQRRMVGAPNADQLAIMANLVEANARLRQEVETLEDQLREYQQAAGRGVLEALVDELNRVKIVNGLVEVSGPGVEVRLDGPLSALDMQDLINELRNAGAEALALGNERLIVSSVVASAEDGTITLNGAKIARPYVLRAIGHPEAMEKALLRSGGLLAALEGSYEGLEVTVVKRDKMVLPVYKGALAFQYASPAD
ncbi:MAG TPA: DUF881 domain-containing protein [Anaerolineae bacterium]|nr:DUF881 domain-containing protein [Anaerolineae bacterium]